jgi:hypothetical protein
MDTQKLVNGLVSHAYQQGKFCGGDAIQLYGWSRDLIVKLRESGAIDLGQQHEAWAALEPAFIAHGLREAPKRVETPAWIFDRA